MTTQLSRPPRTRVTPTIAPRTVLRRQRPVSSTAITFWFGIVVAAVIVAAATVGPYLGLPDPSSNDLTARLLPPGAEGHLLGTDQLGRDVLSRTIAGAQWTLGIGVTATIIGLLFGTAIGVGAAWAGPRMSTVLSRVIDVGLSFPYLVIAITVVAIAGKSFLTLAITLGLVSWPPVARVMFAETLGLRNREYVVAARLLGAGGLSIVWAHILPGLFATIRVMAAFIFAEMMISESGMSFLGLGAPLGEPTWGNALSEARGYMAAAPWLLLAPAISIVLVVVSANFIGDGLTAMSKKKEQR